MKFTGASKDSYNRYDGEWEWDSTQKLHCKRQPLAWIYRSRHEAFRKLHFLLSLKEFFLTLHLLEPEHYECSHITVNQWVIAFPMDQNRIDQYPIDITGVGEFSNKIRTSCLAQKRNVKIEFNISWKSGKKIALQFVNKQTTK